MNEQNIPPVPEEVDKDWELMKKAGKIISRLFLAFCVICVLYMIPSVRETYWKARTVAYVRLHEDALNEYVESFPLVQTPISKEYETYHGWNVGCYAVHEGSYNPDSYDIAGGDPYVIHFYCYSFGLVTSGAYAGMYYSPDDTPSGFQGVLGNPKCETEKICDHWYWYIAWF